MNLNKSMKCSSLFFLMSILGMTFFIAACSKEEDQDTRSMESIIREMTDGVSSDSLESYVSWMEGMGTRFALADNHRDIAVAISRKFKMLGYSDVQLDSFMIDKVYKDIRYLQWQYNVIATLKGNIYPDSVSIIGAHYDNNLKINDPFLTVPGANDNASGVAAALEVARIMKKSSFNPGNTIEFIAFGAEEVGLWGSRAYATRAAESSKKIKIMLNNDMIAYEPGTGRSGWIVNIKDYDNSHDLRMEAEKMCSQFTLLGFKNDNTYNQQSDSYPFFENGFKALFFFSNTVDPVYHTLNDLAVNCDFDYCREIVNINCALLVYNN